MPSSGDLPDPGIEPLSLGSPALVGGFWIRRCESRFHLRVYHLGCISLLAICESLDSEPREGTLCKWPTQIWSSSMLKELRFPLRKQWASLVAQLVKESACNAGDPGSVHGLRRSPGEGLGYPLQYSWGSLVAKMVKNPSAMQDTWVWSLGQEDPLKEGMATHARILAWRIPMDRRAWWATVRGITKSQTRLSD